MIENRKEEFGKYFEHISVMEGMKSIEMPPVIDAMPLSMVATYLEVPQSRISSYYSNHAVALKSLGCKRLFLSDFANAGYKVSKIGKRGTSLVEYGDFGMTINNTGARCLSKEAIFLVAMNITGGFPERVQAEVMNIANANPVLTDNANHNDIEIVADVINTDTMISEPETIFDNIFSFDNPELGSVRALSINNEPWFVGKDVAQVLGYSNTRDALNKHVDAEDKSSVAFHDGTSGNPNQTIINESGLYSMILSSKLPSAKKFKRWVTSEVLPSLRKNNAYIVGQDQMSETELIANALIACKRIIDEQKTKIQTQSETIKVFTDKTNTWDSRSVLNALIRSYAVNCFNGNFAFAFNDFYKQFDYKYHTRLKLRKNSDCGKRVILDCLNPVELHNALKLAISICYAHDIDVAAVVNGVNLSVYST